MEQHAAVEGLITFLQDLVRIPSVCGRDPEQAVATRIVEEATKLRLKAELHAHPLAPQRPNVLVSFGTSSAHDVSLLLNTLYTKGKEKTCSCL
jgi:acetylornithine deacetylase/succinyl-diaminopimelate desuccinylase-like protein